MGYLDAQVFIRPGMGWGLPVDGDRQSLTDKQKVTLGFAQRMQDMVGGVLIEHKLINDPDEISVSCLQEPTYEYNTANIGVTVLVRRPVEAWSGRCLTIANGIQTKLYELLLEEFATAMSPSDQPTCSVYVDWLHGEGNLAGYMGIAVEPARPFGARRVG